MLSVLMTSTMKSDPLRDSVRRMAAGRTFSFGGTGGTVDVRGAAAFCAPAAVVEASVATGAAATTPARNSRRFISGLRFMITLPVIWRICHPALPNPSRERVRQRYERKSRVCGSYCLTQASHRVALLSDVKGFADRKALHRSVLEQRNRFRVRRLRES